MFKIRHRQTRGHDISDDPDLEAFRALKRGRRKAELALQGRPDLDEQENSDSQASDLDEQENGDSQASPVRIQSKKRGPKPKYRPRYESINDLGTGLESIHPPPLKDSFEPTDSTKHMLKSVESIKYSRRRCILYLTLTNGRSVKTDHFLYWRFANAKSKLLIFFKRVNPLSNSVYFNLYRAAGGNV